MTFEEAMEAEPAARFFVCRTIENDLGESLKEHVEKGAPYSDGQEGAYRAPVVEALKAKIAELQDQLRSHEIALANRETELAAERGSKFSEAGWFLPRDMVTENVGISLDHLIARAKHTSIVNVTVSPGQPYEIQYEADWVKYLRKIEPQASQTWIVKLGSAVAHLHEPSLVNRVSASKQEETIKRLMNDLGSPNSISLAQAFKQFANEICYGHVSLESAVQKAAGGYDGKLRSEAPHADTWSYMHPYAVPAERLAGNASAAADCADPKNCCTRNRPLHDQDCKRKSSIVNAAPVTTEPGIKDTSTVKEFTCAECPHQAVLEGCCGRNTLVYPEQTKPVYSETALQDPTNLQKAVIMGMVGSPEQQEEARGFLMQYLAVNGLSKAAVDAYLTQ